MNIIKRIYDFINNKKIFPHSTILTKNDVSNDITTYIRCLFHDFRGPLNNITMAKDVLLSSTTLHDDDKEIIQIIHESCVFMSDYLDGLLNVNNLKNVNNPIDTIILNYEPFHIIGLLKKIQYILILPILKKKIEIKYIINHLHEWVIGDQKQLQHVLVNLLSNAVKFAKDNSTITIKIESKSIEHKKQPITISVIDENDYIPPHIKSKLFKKYVTSDNIRGTGLGLFLCKTIIELHGGTITHENHQYTNNNNVIVTGNLFKIYLEMEICASGSAKLQSSPNSEFILEDAVNNLDILNKNNTKKCMKNHNSIRYINNILLKNRNSIVSSSLMSYRNMDTSNNNNRKFTDDKKSKRNGTNLTPNVDCTPTKDVVNGIMSTETGSKQDDLSAAILVRPQSTENILVTSTGSNKNIKKTKVEERGYLREAFNVVTSIPMRVIASSISKEFVNTPTPQENTSKRVFIIDDSELSRKLMKRLFKQNCENIKLYEAEDGLDAVLKLNGSINSVDLIMLDNIMPNITGVLLSRIIRGLGYKGLIFGITGNGVSTDIDEFIHAGADYIFVKPFNKEKIDKILYFVKKNGYMTIPNGKIIESESGELVWKI